MSLLKSKPKPCVSCGREDLPHFSRQRCLPCSRKAYGKPKPVSDKRKEQLKDYSILRKEFLEKHPNCQAKLVGCLRISSDVHHSDGRTNEKINDTSKWLALCRHCHSICHDKLSASEARKLGLKQ